MSIIFPFRQLQNINSLGTFHHSYFIWSGWSDSSHQVTQNLYIASMSSPTQISGNRVLLHEPTPAWQQSGGEAINEGPEILFHNGRTFLIYCEYTYSVLPLWLAYVKLILLIAAAAGSWTPQYCLAMMGIDNGTDPRTSALPRSLRRTTATTILKLATIHTDITIPQSYRATGGGLTTAQCFGVQTTCSAPDTRRFRPTATVYRTSCTTQMRLQTGAGLGARSARRGSAGTQTTRPLSRGLWVSMYRFHFLPS